MILAACSRFRFRAPQIVILLSLLAPALPLAAEPDERERAIAAMGGRKAVERAASGEVVLEGIYYAREQGRNPSDSIQPAGRWQRIAVDANGRRGWRDAELHYPGGVHFFSRAVMLPDGGFSIDLLRWRQGTDIGRLNAAQSASSLATFERLLPHWTLLQESSDARLAFHPDGTVASVSSGPAEVQYHSYIRTSGGLMLPRYVRIFQQGVLQEDLIVRRFRPRSLRQREFTLPAGYSDPPAALPPAAAGLAPGIRLFENMPGGYRSIFIEKEDHVIVVESPLSSGYAKTQLEVIRRMTSKPVRYVVVTHHHGDHTGGLPVLAAEGATIVVPRGAGEAIRRQFASRNDPPPRIEEVEGNRTLGAGVELYAISSSHVDANLLVYLPEPRILFQGDFFFVPERGTVPRPFPVAHDLARAIDRLQLRPSTIIGVHGRPATWEEFRRALR